MRKNKLLLVGLSFILVSVLASGCIFGPSEDAGSTPIDPPQVDYTSDDDADIEFDFSEADENVEGVEGDNGDEASTKEQERELYVFDHEGRVVPITVTVPATEGVAKQSLEYLVADGPISQLLPDGKRAVLPAGTEMTVRIIEDEKTAVVDFSKEFENYQVEDERGILEAITWTLTQFDSIENVNIMINGYMQDVMPVGGTPISQPMSRHDGINLEIAQGAQVGFSSAVTLYFKSESLNGDYSYYVPVTRIIPRESDLVQATIEQLIAGPEYGSGLYTEMITSTQILDLQMDDNVATINFDEQFMRNADDEPYAPHSSVMSLVLSLTKSGLAEEVLVQVDGQSDIVCEEGMDLSKPVTKPKTTNASSF